MNCARIQPHIRNVQADHTIKKSDIIHLQETWITEPQENMEMFNMPGYKVNHIKVAKGKGITTYHRKSFSHVCDKVSQNYQITKYESKNVVSINVYRSAKGNTDEIIDEIKNMQDENKANIVTGDVNICARKHHNNRLTQSLCDENFQLLTKTATHIKGGHIDHAYSKNAKATMILYTPYYSDHDALRVVVEEVWASGEWQKPE